jgi:tol-pal system-associated acyl-CoA thioesterase
MEDKIFHHAVQIFYEDTDFSGTVFHANYLKYFERARSSTFGADNIIRIMYEHKIGFAVYKANLTFSEPARYGDILDIRTTYKFDGEFRIIWNQEAWKQGGIKPAVTGEIHLVCLDESGRLQKFPKIL